LFHAFGGCLRAMAPDRSRTETLTLNLPVCWPNCGPAARPERNDNMTLLTRRAALKLGLAGGALLATAPMSLAQLRIVVEGANFQPLPIAIPDFASSDPNFGREIADIVRANLRRSGLFLPLDPASLPVRVGDPNGTPDFNTWRTANVDALVMGGVE